jgi:hypothetical protein
MEWAFDASHIGWRGGGEEQNRNRKKGFKVNDLAARGL